MLFFLLTKELQITSSFFLTYEKKTHHTLRYSLILTAEQMTTTNFNGSPNCSGRRAWKSICLILIADGKWIIDQIVQGGELERERRGASPCPQSGGHLFYVDHKLLHWDLPSSTQKSYIWAMTNWARSTDIIPVFLKMHKYETPGDESRERG